MRTTRACHSHLSMRWRPSLKRRAALTPLLAGLELFFQRGQFGERRIRIGLSAAPVLWIDPLARLTAIAVLEIAPAFTARAAILAIAIRALAAAALTRGRTPFPLGLVTAFASVAACVTRLAIVTLFGLRSLGWSSACVCDRRRCLRTILRGNRLRRCAARRAALVPFARGAWRALPTLFRRTARAPHLDHLGFGRLILSGGCFGSLLGRSGFGGRQRFRRDWCDSRGY